MTIWFKNNKAAEKWTEKEVEVIFKDTYKHIMDTEKNMLKSEVDLYMLTTHGVSHQLRSVWLNKIYKDNISICNLWSAIDLTIENRLVYDESKRLRPNIQAMVLQNKHNYSDKKDVTVNNPEGTRIIIEHNESKPEKKED